MNIFEQILFGVKTVNENIIAVNEKIDVVNEKIDALLSALQFTNIEPNESPGSEEHVENRESQIY